MNRLLAAPLSRSVRISLAAAYPKFGILSERILKTILRNEIKVSPMFMLPAYDPTAIAMLGFGILAVLGLPFIF